MGCIYYHLKEAHFSVSFSAAFEVYLVLGLICRNQEVGVCSMAHEENHEENKGWMCARNATRSAFHFHASD